MPATRSVQVEKKTLVALAYATARDQKLAPKAILIRLVLLSFLQVLENPTCTILPPSKANMSKIPKAGMAPSPFKADDQVEREFHVASHGRSRTKLLGVEGDLERLFGQLRTYLKNMWTVPLVTRTYPSRI
ncbi:hypothetical protein I7I51_06847, partial [Histoplasma capsulatum]